MTKKGAPRSSSSGVVGMYAKLSLSGGHEETLYLVEVPSTRGGVSGARDSSSWRVIGGEDEWDDSVEERGETSSPANSKESVASVSVTF